VLDIGTKKKQRAFASKVDPLNNTGVDENWYRTSFDAFYPIVYAHRTVEAAESEAVFAAEQVGLRAGEHVLDLCCGNGRHIVHLLRRTPFVVGLDYSSDLLALARENLGDRPLLLRGDMRAIGLAESFDVVTNFFTSFGYFSTPEENLRVVHEVARVLRPGGRFVVDYLNAAYVAGHLVPESVREHDGYTIRERRWIDAVRRRVNKTTRLYNGDDALGEWGESVQLYEETEFRALLAQGGLEVDRVFGDYTGASMDAERPRMIVIGHKEERRHA